MSDKAFYRVDGERNPSEGPPTDGLEYLMSVKFESRRIPDTMVAPRVRAKRPRPAGGSLPIPPAPSTVSCSSPPVSTLNPLLPPAGDDVPHSCDDSNNDVLPKPKRLFLGHLMEPLAVCDEALLPNENWERHFLSSFSTLRDVRCCWR